MKRIAEPRRLSPEILLRAGICIHRHEIVQPFGLHAMTGIIENTNRVRASGPEAGAMILEGNLHLVFRGILNQRDLEPDAFQRIGDQVGILDRIGQLPPRLVVVGISDHQGNARLRNRGAGQAEDADDQTEGKFQVHARCPHTLPRH